MFVQFSMTGAHAAGDKVCCIGAPPSGEVQHRTALPQVQNRAVTVGMTPLLIIN